MNYKENNTLYLNTAKAWKEGNVLTVSGKFLKVNYFLTNCKGSTSNITEVYLNKSFTCSFTSEENYSFLSFVNVTGCKSYEWDSANGLLTVSECYETVNIYVNAVKPADLSKFFQITCYYNRAEQNRVNKINHITTAGNIQGVLREECDILFPSILIESSTMPNWNYCYIHLFGERWYFVTGVSSVRNNLWRIDLSVDVLMTYRNAINDCQGFVDRNEYNYNPNIIDKKRVIELGQDIETIEIPNGVIYVNGEDITTEIINNTPCFFLTGFYMHPKTEQK